MPHSANFRINNLIPRDPLFRLFFINGIAGLLIAAVVFAGIFWANIGNLRVLVLGAEDPVIPVIMLAGGLVITLGSVVIGSAIMLLGSPRRSGGSGGQRAAVMPLGTLQPIPVRVEARRQRS
ncbi:MAG: hypothetical protein ABJL55_00590 [Roseibium sp.]